MPQEVQKVINKYKMALTNLTENAKMLFLLRLNYDVICGWLLLFSRLSVLLDCWSNALVLLLPNNTCCYWWRIC